MDLRHPEKKNLSDKGNHLPRKSENRLHLLSLKSLKQIKIGLFFQRDLALLWNVSPRRERIGLSVIKPTYQEQRWISLSFDEIWCMSFVGAGTSWWKFLIKMSLPHILTAASSPLANQKRIKKDIKLKLWYLKNGKR